MYKRFFAAIAFILFASALVIFSARELPQRETAEKPAKTVVRLAR